MTTNNTSSDQLRSLQRAVSQNKACVLGPAALVLLGLGGQLATHVVAKGDTLYEIARESGATVDEIATANGISNPNLIVVGQKLTVPESSDIVWVVQEGDTVYSIAASQGVTVAEVVSRNGLSSSALIREGEHLRIPGSGSDDLAADEGDSSKKAKKAEKKAVKKAKKKAAEKQSKAAERKAARKAAKQADRDAAAAAAEEPVAVEPEQPDADTSDSLSPPVEPAPAPQPAPVTPAAPSVTTIYVVQGGDSIASIASLFNIDPQTLANANGVAVDGSLEAGARLLIPNSGNN